MRIQHLYFSNIIYNNFSSVQDFICSENLAKHISTKVRNTLQSLTSKTLPLFLSLSVLPFLLYMSETALCFSDTFKLLEV